jgi:hypothetical protein
MKNFTNSGNNEEDRGDANLIWIQVLTLYVPALLIIFGFIGNILIWLTFHLMRDRNSVIAFHYKILAVVCLFDNTKQCTMIFLFHGQELIESGGTILCKVDAACAIFHWTAVWCIVTICLDRLITLYSPARAKTCCTKKKAMQFLFFSFVCQLMLLVPEFVTTGSPSNTERNMAHTFVPCVFGSKQSIVELPHIVQETVGYIWMAVDLALPWVIVFVANALLLSKITKKQSKCSSPGKSVNREEMSALPMVMIMSFFFLLVHLAIPIHRFYWFWYIVVRNEFLIQTTGLLATVVCGANIQLNFFMFVVISKNFRADVGNMFRKVGKCGRAEVRNRIEEDALKVGTTVSISGASTIESNV